MCDYSLERTASRPAKVGDKLTTSSFMGTITHGFAAVEEPEVAICLLPGTEIAFEDEVRYQAFLGRKTKPHRTAIFRRVNEQQPYAFHDALEFPDGSVILLATLPEGQHARVLQLPVSANEPRIVREIQTVEPPFTPLPPARPARASRILELLRLR
jgi:hypothetical protein